MHPRPPPLQSGRQGPAGFKAGFKAVDGFASSLVLICLPLPSSSPLPLSCCSIPRRRRNGSVDATRQGTLTEAAQAEAVQAAAAEAAAEAEAEEVASTPIISAASSLLGQHLAGGPSGSASAAGSPASSVSGAAAAAMMRSQLSAKDLFVAQADAVMAHAQVQSLQTALRKVRPGRGAGGWLARAQLFCEGCEAAARAVAGAGQGQGSNARSTSCRGPSPVPQHVF